MESQDHILVKSTYYTAVYNSTVYVPASAMRLTVPSLASSLMTKRLAILEGFQTVSKVAYELRELDDERFGNLADCGATSALRLGNASCLLVLEKIQSVPWFN